MNSEFSFQLVAAPLLSFLVAYLLIFWLVKGNALKILDFPNKRSLHSTPVPRTGGIGLIFSILFVWLLFSASLPISLWVWAPQYSVIGISIDADGRRECSMDKQLRLYHPELADSDVGNYLFNYNAGF